MTPFMQLTLTDGTPCFISILQVVLVEPREGKNNDPNTYIVLAGGGSFTRYVKDSYDSVMEAIICYHKNKDFVRREQLSR